MEPMKFKEADIEFGANQPEYKPLPAYRTDDGVVVSCWRLSLWERIRVLFTGCVWGSVLTDGRSLQPLALHSKFPLIPAEENQEG